MADNIVKRSGKKAYMRIGDTICRMRGFTTLSKSMNAKEYSRQYVDEDSERTDVTGYAESISFGMDYFKGDAVHAKIIDIFGNELIGSDATVEIITVDFSQNADDDGAYPACSRTYAVVPSSEGDSTDAYTYSGDFKANGGKTNGKAKSADDWQTITFTE